ncbi:MAG TPA: DCC1-like thiol-disulfide oxidoreductase family protein, partial [Planctomycetota bacterium]|nr:DCC1-like thiol-disulfide oxidoreductase family protein [Planctomycetota bacterium]
MRKLTVLYDASCGFCTQCRWWMEKQPAFLELEFVPAAATDARRRFPSLSTGLEELVAVDDEGGVYRGARAFVICLYALREYRELSMRLGSPVLLPFARMALKLL